MFTRRSTVVIMNDICLICSNVIKTNQSKINCVQDSCHYHKKCFKYVINYENDRAMNLGYNVNKKYKKEHCDCGCKIKVNNSRGHIFRKYRGMLIAIPFILLI